jgi:PhnB protein
MQPNINFPGNAEEVLEYYRDAFGGELEFVRFGGSPAAGMVPPDWANKVLYGTLRSPLGTINVMDAPPGRGSAPGGNIAISLFTTTEAQTDAVFAKLAAGGQVMMPLEKTFWSPKFGMCVDKFGTHWMVSLAPSQVAA